MGGVLINNYKVITVSAKNVEILKAADHHQVFDPDRGQGRFAGREHLIMHR